MPLGWRDVANENLVQAPAPKPLLIAVRLGLFWLPAQKRWRCGIRFLRVKGAAFSCGHPCLEEGPRLGPGFPLQEHMRCFLQGLFIEIDDRFAILGTQSFD